jgi:hypothetical protein
VVENDAGDVATALSDRHFHGRDHESRRHPHVQGKADAAPRTQIEHVGEMAR